jgi:hypothetical protein
MFSGRALPSCRCRPLSSNVMPQKSGTKAPPITDIRNRQFKVRSESWLSRAVGLVASGRLLAISRLVARVAPGPGGKSILSVVPAALAACWPMIGGGARRSGALARGRAGLKGESQSSSLGQPPWGGLAGLGRCQGGRQGSGAGQATALGCLGLSGVPGEVHVASRRWLRHNTSLKRSAIGRPPVPGLLHAKHSHRPGPVVLPLAPA